MWTYTEAGGIVSCVCTHGDQLFCASYDRLIRCYNKTVRVGTKIILMYMQIVILLDISTLNKTCNNSTAISIELLNFQKIFIFQLCLKKYLQVELNYKTPYFAYRVESCSGFIMVQGQRMDLSSE